MFTISVMIESRLPLAIKTSIPSDAIFLAIEHLVIIPPRPKPDFACVIILDAIGHDFEIGVPPVDLLIPGIKKMLFLLLQAIFALISVSTAVPVWIMRGLFRYVK